jgi:Multisubunit Na+/H+ antiporter, MnhC subunit
MSCCWRSGTAPAATPPVFVSLPAHPGPAVDAVMQALALTDVVVGAAVTALLLALVVQVHKRPGRWIPTRSGRPGTDRREPRRIDLGRGSRVGRGPLGGAALMVGFSRFLPRRARDLIAIAVALATTTLTLILMAASAGTR